MSGFGQLAFALAFLSYALLLGNPGLTALGTREVAKDPASRIVRPIVLARAALAAAIMMLLSLAVLLVPGDTRLKTLILIYSLTLVPYAINLEFVFQGWRAMKSIAAARLLQHALYLGIVVLALRQWSDLRVVPTALVLSNACAAVLLLLFFRRRRHGLAPTATTWRLTAVMAGALPIGLATIAYHLALNLPPLVLGAVRSPADVGLFSAAFRVITFLLIIERVFYYVFFPVLATRARQHPGTMPDAFTALAHLILLLVLPIACGVALLAPRFLYLIYGGEYAAGAWSLRILAGYFLIAPFNTLFGYGLVAMDRERIFFRILASQAALSACLTLILGMLAGSPGICVGLVVAELFGVCRLVWTVRHVAPLAGKPIAARPLIAGAIMAPAAWLLRDQHLALAILGAAACYAVGLLAAGEFTTGTRAALSRNLR